MTVHLPAPGALWETLRHLRARQLRFQVSRRVLPRAVPRPLPVRWRALSPRVGGCPARRPAFDGRAAFTFNNETRAFSGDWNEAGARKLWLYNLHYMAWILDLAPGEGEEWIRRWIRENPPERGGNGWEPYPASLRLFNWCKRNVRSGRAPDADVLASLGLHAAWVLANLEFHLDGNHLLENLLALAYAGLYLDGEDPVAARALSRTAVLLSAALDEQFLPDGGHYERSPMYHAILLERMLDLLDVWPEGGDPLLGIRPRLEETASRALDWLEVMSPGGELSLFNDSALDSAPRAADLITYGRCLTGRPSPGPAPLRSLPDSGYYCAERGPVTVIFDGGALGPDHQMGHAQGDMLSFCLWLDGAPLVVHPGNYEYVPGEMRDYCRSTASHNTLVFDGEEQAEWWASHRVGFRGHPRDVRAGLDPATNTVRLVGSHDGFSRLPGRPIHTRELALAEGSLTVLDRVSARPRRGCRIHYHFHPNCAVTTEGGRFRIRSAGGSMTLDPGGPAHIADSWYCPEFGIRLRNRAVIVEGLESEYRGVLTLET